MVSSTRTCVRLLTQSAEPSAISNADMVSLETVELPRFSVGMMESGAKMNLQFYNALVSVYKTYVARSVLHVISLEVLIKMSHYHS